MFRNGYRMMRMALGLAIVAGLVTGAHATATAWSNGVGFGSGTVIASDPDGTVGRTTTGFGGAAAVSSPRGWATASCSWGALWSVTIGGSATMNSSYGHDFEYDPRGGDPNDAGAGSVVDVYGEVVAGGPTGWRFHLLGVADTYGSAAWQVGVFGVPVETIPEDYDGWPDDLVSDGYVTPEDVLILEYTPIGDPTHVEFDLYVDVPDLLSPETITCFAKTHGAVVPEPASLSLLGIGALAWLRRRRV